VNEASLPSVLVFDSGVGGLSVAASIRRLCPQVPLVYLADNAGFPYGDKPEAEVTRRTCNLVTSALSKFDCQIVVLACNTASTVALPALRQCVSEAVWVSCQPSNRRRRSVLIAVSGYWRRRPLWQGRIWIS
jgi:glutamate racemase